MDHPRRKASRVIQWYDLIHETLYSAPDQVTIIIMCLYSRLYLCEPKSDLLNLIAFRIIEDKEWWK